MTAKILDGRQLGQSIQQTLRAKIAEYRGLGRRAPRLDVILVGDDPASAIYVSHKTRACEAVGIQSVLHALPTDTSYQALSELIDSLNVNTAVDGILLQLPLPRSISLQSAELLEHINPQKDVDGLHPYNLGRLLQRKPLLRPCTPYGIIQLLEDAQIDCTGKHAVIVSASNIVGRPMAMELLLKKATTTVCHRFTTDLETHIRSADILISATGKSGIILSEWLKPGAIVIDVGIQRGMDGHIFGDLEFDSAFQKAGWITPVPGGVGPMTIATLLQNTVKAYLLQHPLSIRNCIA